MKIKRKQRRRFINGAKGAISILLCLLMTPFMSIALGLVEYYRYQNVISLTNELMELTGLSALSDYDDYMHKRFGLLSISQEQDLNTQGTELLETNVDALGKQVTLNSTAVSGSLALSHESVLRQQVVDVSELTATTAVLMDDFNIQLLLDQLKVVEQFESIINTVDNLADLSTALVDAIEAGEKLQKTLEDLQAAINSAKTQGENLAVKLRDLYQKLSANGIYIPENADLEAVTEIVTKFASEYAGDITAIAGASKELLDKLKEIKLLAGTLQTDAKGFVDAVKAAQKAVENMSGDSNQNASISKEARSTLEEVLRDMVTLAEQTAEEIKADVIKEMKAAVDDMIKAATDSLGITDIAARYASMKSGEYFKLPLSDIAKNDLTKLLSLVPKAWEEGTAEQILAELKAMLVPKITFDPDYLIGQCKEILKKASEAVENKVKSKVLDLLTDLVNTVKHLFDLDVFYEADLNAFVDIAGGGEHNAYQDFIDAVGDIFTAVDDFKAAMKDKGIISKAKKILEAIGDLFDAIGDVLQSILDISKLAIDSITELGKCVLSGDLRGLYEKILIAGYMRHNLPNRLSSGSYKTSYDNESGTANVKVTLSGTGLTGFDYNDIARPASVLGQKGTTGFDGMAKLVKNLKQGHGSDTMFKGAELEYIRAGTNSELANQIIVFFDMYFLRLLLGAPAVFGDVEVAAVATTATIASWAVYLLYLVAEPFCDVVLLVNDETVPLIKSKCFLTGSGLPGFVNKLSSAVMSDELKAEFDKFTDNYASGSSGGSGGSGGSSGGSSGGGSSSGGLGNSLLEVEYETHVLILLMVYVESDAMIERFADIVELETAEHYRQQGKSFSMSKTYTAVSVDADVTFNALFDLGIASGGAAQIFNAKLKRTIGY